MSNHKGFIITHQNHGSMELQETHPGYSWLVKGDYVSVFTTRDRAEFAIRGSIEAVAKYCGEKGMEPFGWSRQDYYKVMELK